MRSDERTRSESACLMEYHGGRTSRVFDGGAEKHGRLHLVYSFYSYTTHNDAMLHYSPGFRNVFNRC